MTSWKKKTDQSEIPVSSFSMPIQTTEFFETLYPISPPSSVPSKYDKDPIKEGFEIFDDNYFKNCYNWLDKLGGELNSLGIVSGYRELVKYLTCPIYSFDALLLNYIYHIIRYVYLAYCESRGLESFVESIDSYDQEENNVPDLSPSDPLPSDSPALSLYATSSNKGFDKLTPSQQQSVNSIISNHLDWIIQNNDPNDVFTQNIVNVIIQTYFVNYNQYIKSQDSNVLIEFDMFFNMQLSDPGIINDIKNQAIALNPPQSLMPEQENPENPENPEEPDNSGKGCFSKLNRRKKEFIKYAKIIRDEIYTILQIPIMIFVVYNIFFVFFFINEYDRPEIYFPNIHLNYWLKKFSSMSKSIEKEYNYVLKNGYGGVEDLHQETAEEKEFAEDQKPAEDPPKITSPAEKFYQMTMKLVFSGLDTRTFLHTGLDFVFEIFWKPYISIHGLLESYRNTFANNYEYYELKKYTWALFYLVLMTVLFFFNYVHRQIVTIAEMIETIISGKSVYDFVVNSAFYTILYSYCSYVIVVAFTAYLIKTFTIDLYTASSLAAPFPFSLLYWIGKKFFTVVFRLICVILLMTPSAVLCVLYCLALFIGAMRYFSVRGNVWSSMKAINKVVYTSIFQNTKKPSSEDPENLHNWDPKSEEELPSEPIDAFKIIYELLLMVPKYQFVYLMELPILMILITGISTYEKSISDPKAKEILIIINTLAIFILLFFMWNKGFKADHKGYSLLGSWKKLEIFRIFSGFINFFKINMYDTKSTLEEIYGL